MDIPSMVVRICNPLHLDPILYVVLYIAHTFAKSILETLVMGIVGCFKTPILPSRANNPPKVEMIFSDYVCLILNSMIEFIFTNHTLIFALYSGKVALQFHELTFLNTIPAFILIFAADDLVYAPAHRFMHWPPIYPLIHKHHHRMIYPFRGYFDAANESPIEQLIGMSCVFFALHATSLITGLHAITLLVFFVVYAMTAMLNHTPYDVKLWFGFEYTVRAHEMHHRFYTCNYAQNFMFWDVLMGTYRPYVGANTEKTEKAN